MDHTCYKCGASIQEGTPFCPQCGAPQIRVTTPDESALAETPAFDPGTPAEMQPPAEPVPLAPQAPLPRVTGPNKIHWRDARSAIVIGGIVAGLGPALAQSLIWILACVLGGAAIAVGLYHRRHVTPIASNMGAKIGTAAAAIGYAISSILAILAFVGSQEVRNELVTKLKAMPIQARDAQSAEIMRDMVAKVTSPEGLALMFTFALAILAAVYIAFGALGGVIGASLTRRGSKQR